MRAYLPLSTDADASAEGAADALVFEGEAAAAAIAALARKPVRPRLLARLGAIGSPDFGPRLGALVAARPDALVLPVAHGREVADLGARLAVEEAVHGLPDGGIGIVALVARAEAVLHPAAFFDASPRLVALGWDAGALSGQLGARVTWDAGWIPPLAQVRALVRLAAAAAGVAAVDAAYPGEDAPGCRRAIAEARRDGFAVMLARDPAQAALIRAET